MTCSILPMEIFYVISPKLEELPDSNFASGMCLWPCIMTHAKFHFNRLMLTLMFGIWASEPPWAWRTTEKAALQKVTDSALAVGRVALGWKRGHPKDLSMNKTVCKSCLSTLIFSMSFTCLTLALLSQKSSFKRLLLFVTCRLNDLHV